MDIWQVKQIKVADLLPNQKNPRKISKENLEKLKSKIERLGFHNPVKVDDKMKLLGGNQRVKALLEMGAGDLLIPVMVPNRPLTKKEKDEIIITDNISDGEWDWDILKEDWNMDDLNDWGLEWELEEEETAENNLSEEDTEGGSGSLKRKYLASPFSILDAKQGDWLERKRNWVNLGIKSEEGRKDHLTFTSTEINVSDYYDQKKKAEKKVGRKLEKEEFEEKYLDRSREMSSSSIFDPVLCEILYSWFSKEGDKVIDPFAGGSVRGIVASFLNRDYTGIDLRPEQIQANESQAQEICEVNKPQYITGDSSAELPKLKNKSFDFCLSCPPYGDLEVYSDLPEDLSNMPYEKFVEVYRKIILSLYDKMKDDTFVAWVVGEIRGKDGNMRSFVPETINAFLDAGFSFYNDMILATSLGSSMLRTRAFAKSRKVVKVHQNVLVFVKGDGKKATNRLGDVEILTDFSENEE